MLRLLAVFTFLSPLVFLPVGCSQISDICKKVEECGTEVTSDARDACAAYLEDAEARATTAGCEPQMENVLDCLLDDFKCGDELPSLGTCETGFGITCQVTSVGIACQAQNAGFESCLE